jgi:Protein of unknown function (DUF4230)
VGAWRGRFNGVCRRTRRCAPLQAGVRDETKCVRVRILGVCDTGKGAACMTTNIPQSDEHSTNSIQSVEAGRGMGCGRGCLYVLVGLAIVLLLLNVLPLLLGGAAVSGIAGILQGVFNTAAPPPSASVVSSQVIVRGIEQLGELVTVSAQLAQADIQVGIAQGMLNACGFSANHVAEGTIDAGIDLQQITEDAITYNAITDTYTLNVPPPQLTRCTVSSRQYDRSVTACSVDWDEARILAEYTALNAFRDEAIEGGILTRAERETRLVLGSFVQAITDANVEITFSTPAQAAPMIAECVPSAPAGWMYDAVTGQWSKAE